MKKIMTRLLVLVTVMLFLITFNESVPIARQCPAEISDSCKGLPCLIVNDHKTCFQTGLFIINE